ncbi:MAG TPA: 3-phosphoshikimate 1-carboxyvinyltransferase [Rhodothermales bacterium]|nr:3-phosphoshikimate 1-carboxyvinyltransferase [Rhodothermales bacterium]
MDYTVSPAKRLFGTIRPPADKSVAHRAAIFASIADGDSRIQGYPRGADTLSTVDCLRSLGVRIEWENDTLVVEGRGRGSLRPPSGPLDCGNSGTTMRLLAGLLAGQEFAVELTGDGSLLRRPMDRIADPLRRMGARIELTDGRAPICIGGNSALKSIDYVLPVASAQVKSAVLLAGLFADGTTSVIEPVPTRDHTERMLGLSRESSAGGTVIRSDRSIQPSAVDMSLPGDISSAAFFMVAGLIVADSSVRMIGVGINPSRSGILDVLEQAGARFVATGHRMVGREPVCDLTVATARLTPLRIMAEIAPRLIDEIPVLAVAATRADGTSSFTGVGELRAKESDRIAAVSASLARMGATVAESESGLEVLGPTQLSGAVIESGGDHRIAMAMAVAGLVAGGETRILGADAANVSYPGFWEDLERVAVR